MSHLFNASFFINAMQTSLMWLLRLNSKARGEHLTILLRWTTTRHFSHMFLHFLSSEWFNIVLIPFDLVCAGEGTLQLVLQIDFKTPREYITTLFDR